MTDAEIKAIEDRCEAATKGPWITPGLDLTGQPPFGVCASDELGSMWTLSETYDFADAALIAHSREDIPLLLRELRAARTLLARCRPYVEEAATWGGMRDTESTARPLLAEIDRATGGK